LTVSRKQGAKSVALKAWDELSRELLEVSSLMQSMQVEMSKQQAVLLALMGRVEGISAKLDALEME
jgi:hypothetical protein